MPNPDRSARSIGQAGAVILRQRLVSNRLPSLWWATEQAANLVPPISAAKELPLMAPVLAPSQTRGRGGIDRGIAGDQNVIDEIRRQAGTSGNSSGPVATRQVL